MQPVQLHVIHDWGGGAARWVEAYCRADRRRSNLVFKPVADAAGIGRRLALCEGTPGAAPVARWELDPPLLSAAVTHPRYHAALREILETWGVEAILVSSLVGHSLDVLATGLPTAVVLHDYYPFCPAIHITYRDRRQGGPGTVCSSCTPGRLAECLARNEHHRFFDGLTPGEALAVRAQFVALAQSPPVTLVAPSLSVERHLVALEPRLAGANFRVIPHGVAIAAPEGDSPISGTSVPEGDSPIFAARKLGQSPARLTAVVLGRLSPEKGLHLLREALPELSRLCDVVLLGCGKPGRALARAGVRVIPDYDRVRLPALLAELGADFGLLLSVVPETFSYTLSELIHCRLPPVAVNRGSFADRIEDGATGFLIAPAKEDLLGKVRMLCARPEWLAAVRRRLDEIEPRSLEAMVREYHEVLPLPWFSERRRAVGLGAAVAGRLRAAAAPPVLAGDKTFEARVDEVYAVARVKVACTPRLRPWQRPLVRLVLAGGYGLVKLGCRLVGRRPKNSAA